MKKQSQYSVKYGIIIDVVKEFFMNSKVLQVLEYTKIIERLADKATSAPGRELCLHLLPPLQKEKPFQKRIWTK